MFAKKGIDNNNDNDNRYFYLSKKYYPKQKIIKRNAISISFAIFAISILLMASTVALASSLSTANSNNNIVPGVNGNNNIQKQSEQQPKTHEYTLIAQDTTVEIAPGVRVDAWTYNGTIPTLLGC